MATKYAKSNAINTATTEHIQSYFSQLNPISERIAKTITDTKAAYGVLWYTLNTSDQDEIINETLIKPEITLHYIDGLAAKRSLSTSSLEFSTPGSLTDNVMKDLNQMSIADLQGRHKNDKDTNYIKKSKECYSFDNRSLSTFNNQRVAQKLLKDEGLADAGYRDEHSAPFSYRTRSQINFHLFNNDAQINDVVVTKERNFVLPFNKTKIMNDANNIAKAAMKKHQEITIKKPKQAPPPIPVAKPTLVGGTTIKSTMSKNEQKTVKNSTTDMPDYLKYTPIQNEDEESSSLIPPTIQLRKNSKALLSSSQLSNTTASDEDDHDYYHDDDAQNQLEEVKLLDTNVSLKRGFEFLSNW